MNCLDEARHWAEIRFNQASWHNVYESMTRGIDYGFGHKTRISAKAAATFENRPVLYRIKVIPKGVYAAPWTKGPSPATPAEKAMSRSHSMQDGC